MIDGRTVALNDVVVEIDSKPQPILTAILAAWNSRRLLVGLVKRDLAARYHATLLGNWWMIARPVAEIIPYLVIFGLFFKVKPGPVPYAVFLISGFAPWLFLGGTLTASTNTITRARSLISKIYFPRLILPLNDLAVRLIDYLVLLAASVVIGLMYGIYPGPEIAALPAIVLLAVLLGLGLGLVVTTVCTLHSDLSHAVPAATRLLFYGSAIIYPLSIVPEKIRPWFALNPITTIVDATRWSLFGLERPSLLSFGIAVAITAVVLWLGLYLFLRYEQRMADIL